MNEIAENETETSLALPAKSKSRRLFVREMAGLPGYSFPVLPF